ncbi:MAG: choice-of-anchor Q domain-containing protein, partial [Anaerolineae bacterium]
IYNISGTAAISYSLVEGSGCPENSRCDEQTKFNENPKFEDAANDLRLKEGSPAIDAGDKAAVPARVTTDLDGKPRFVCETVDMGAYEYQTETCP